MKNPNTDPDARYAVPVWNQEVKLYEDFEIGEVDRSIRRTISEGESMLFSSLLMDLHPYVADDIFAREDRPVRQARSRRAGLHFRDGSLRPQQREHLQLRLRPAAFHQAGIPG